MKKIIFFTKNLKIGGMEKALVTLINNINKSEYKVTLALEKYEGKLCQYISKDIDIIDYNLSINKNILIRKISNFIKRIKFVIKNRNKYDCAINYATYSIWGSTMAKICSQNTILFVHSDYYNVYDGKEEEIRNFFNSIKIEYFKKIIFVSKYPKDNLLKVMPEISSKVELLGNLIDYKEILKQSEEYKVDFDKNKINLIFLGRLDESSKKISKLIKTVNNSKELDKFNLYIIGEGPDKKEYENISKTENIIFVGEYQNPYPYIKAGDYLILTSKYEGFPVVYNEATVLKTGIITTIPVEDEQIIYNGNNIIKLNSDLSNFDKIT